MSNVDVEVPKFVGPKLKHLWPTAKPNPKKYLRKGDGDLIKCGAKKEPTITCEPTSGHAFHKRDNPPNTQVCIFVTSCLSLSTLFGHFVV